MSMVSKRFCAFMSWSVVFASLIGCSSMTGLGDPDPGNGESPDPGTDNPTDDSTSEPPVPDAEALLDFSVIDVNANSVRYQAAVSPRDYLGQISAWYFGLST